MSIEAVARALHVDGIGGTTKLVLIGIANHDGDNGSWPSISTLARYAFCTDRAVQKCIARLVTLGYVTVEHNAGGTHLTRGDQRPNRYWLHLAPVDKPANGVNARSPREANGVNWRAQRGELQSINGVNPSSPEPSIEPSKNRAPAAAPPVETQAAAADLCFDCHGPIEPDRVNKWRCAACQHIADQRHQETPHVHHAHS